MGGNTHRTNTLKHLICLALVFFLPAALALEEGTYAIQSCPGFRRISANYDGTSDVKQVITDGKLTMVSLLVVVQCQWCLYFSSHGVHFVSHSDAVGDGC